MFDTEDNLQTAICKLSKIINKYGLTISTDKSKVIAFNGRDSTGSKLEIYIYKSERVCLSVCTFKINPLTP
jgi:hypothetical protein